MNDGIKRMFELPSYFDMYGIIEQTRESLKLQEPQSDKERLEQITWIKAQYRKYVFSKQSAFEEIGDNIPLLIDYVEALIAKAPDSPKDAKTCIYNYLRDVWLINMHGTLSMLAYSNGDGHDGDEHESEE